MIRIKAMLAKIDKDSQLGQVITSGTILKDYPALLDCLAQIREATADTIEAVRSFTLNTTPAGQEASNVMA